MAQNDYGLKILGAVAFTFSFLFGIQLIAGVLNQKSKLTAGEWLELVSLIVISVILGMRVFYLRFQSVEIVFALAGLALVAAYGLNLFKIHSETKTIGKWISIQVWTYYLGMILYVVSMSAVAFIPEVAEPAGATAFLLIMVFVAVGLMSGRKMVDGQKNSPLQLLSRFKDRSVVLLTLFLLFTAYMGLTKVNVLPRLYSDEYPHVYFEMVNKAESGKETPSNGRYQHEIFKEQYDQFVKKHSSK